jgi:hypothetical protein
MQVFKNLSSGLWPLAQIDEIIALKPASNAFMRRSIGALLDLFFCERYMNRLADGVHLIIAVGGMSTCFARAM